MRLFIGSEVQIKDKNFLKFYEHISKLKCLRPVKLSNLHITYLFIGECEDFEKYIELINNCPFGKKFEITIEGVSFFYTKNNKIRVIFLKVVSENIEKIGKYFNPQFIPHITIARNKNCENKKIENITKTYDLKFNVLINNICLYQSILTKYGPIYKKIYEKILK